MERVADIPGALSETAKNVMVNGVEVVESPAVIASLRHKPLVYNYDDSHEEQWPSNVKLTLSENNQADRLLNVDNTKKTPNINNTAYEADDMQLIKQYKKMAYPVEDTDTDAELLSFEEIVGEYVVGSQNVQHSIELPAPPKAEESEESVSRNLKQHKETVEENIVSPTASEVTYAETTAIRELDGPKEDCITAENTNELSEIAPQIAEQVQLETSDHIVRSNIVPDTIQNNDKRQDDEVNDKLDKIATSEVEVSTNMLEESVIKDISVGSVEQKAESRERSLEENIGDEEAVNDFTVTDEVESTVKETIVWEATEDVKSEGEQCDLSELSDSSPKGDIKNEDINIVEGECEITTEEDTFVREPAQVLKTRVDGQNFRSAILEDWDVDCGATPPASEDLIEKKTEIINKKEGGNAHSSEMLPAKNVENVNFVSNESVTGKEKPVDTFPSVEANENVVKKDSGGPDLVKPTEVTTLPKKNDTSYTENGLGKKQTHPRKSRLLLSTRHISRQEAVQEIVRSKPTPLKSLIPRKDLIFAMELAKHSSQGVGTQVEETVPKGHEDILEILEGDQVSGWREALPSSTGKIGNDLDISRELNVSIENEIIALQSNSPFVPLARSVGSRKRSDGSATRSAKLKKQTERAIERKLALEQLAKEFKERPSPRRRVMPDAPRVVAAVDLERALSSTPVLTGKRKRRPCYQPAVSAEEEADDIHADPSALTTKPCSNSLSEVETALETVSIINRNLGHVDKVETPKEQKTVRGIKKSAPQKKRARELQQLLGDEGAVRMLYDAAQKDAPLDGQPHRVFKKTKKGLEQKTKFVENAVLRLSGASEKSLRGKRLAVAIEENAVVDPLFPPAAPGLAPGETPGKARKKPKPAEASRILYRHSSSESFDGSEGLRRSASEIAGLDVSPGRSTENTSASRLVEARAYPAPQRKSSRPRKVSSKFSVYVAESLTPKKNKKSEEPRSVTELVVKSPPPVAVAPPSCPVPDVTPSQRTTKQAPPTTSTTPMLSRTSKRSAVREVSFTQRGGLVEITLASSQPSIKNGLTTEVLLHLQNALEAASENPACRAVLLTSEGLVFCQGIDLALLAPGTDVIPLVNAIKSFVTTLAVLEKPVIVGVQGPAVGMGVTLLPLCDIVVASDAATFYTPYTRLGQGLEAAASFTFPSIGKALVSELIYMGNLLSSADALRLGLVSQIIPASKYHAELTRVADAVASQSEQALLTAKKLMTSSARQSILEALNRECTALLESWTNAECLSATAEFLATGGLLPNV